MLTWNPSDPTKPATTENGRTESPLAHQVLLDFIRLGPARTLAELRQQYKNNPPAPTSSHGTLRKWSSQYEWPARAAAYDAIEEEHVQHEYRAHRDAILQRGLALQHERIQLLVTMYERLSSLAHTDEALWIVDVKALRLENDRIERIELRRFNGELFRQMRGILDDIATETGGRLNRPQPPAQASDLDMDDYSLDTLPPDERAEFLRLQRKLLSRS